MNKKLLNNSYILLTISVLIYLLGFYFSYSNLFSRIFLDKDFSVIRNLFEYAIMFASFLLFSALLYRYTFGKIIIIILLILVSINFSISYTCFRIYDSAFNSGMVISILDTNTEEVKSMASTFWESIVMSTVVFLINLFTVKSISKKKFNPIWIGFSFIWLALPILFKLKHTFVENKGGGKMIKSILYHYNDFNYGYKLREEFLNIKKQKIYYTELKTQESFDQIVFLIGESVASSRMQLYGYPVPNTPNLMGKTDQMLIYKNALSPGGITNLSVPLILSSIKPEDFTKKKEQLADNIINFANYAGYKTHWLSTQSLSGSISVIASYSQNQKFVSGFDHEILPEFKNAINNNKKNFIILHLIGSHPNPCHKIPNSEKKESNNILDCYDNSILYTDKIIEEILKTLENKNAAFIYTSDHALKIKENKLIHCDSKESTRVPYFIWYSQKSKVKNKTVGTISDTIQTTKIFSDLKVMMGYNALENYKNLEMKYLNLDLKPIEYSQLPD